MHWMMWFTAQRLCLNVDKDFIALRRKIVGGCSDGEHGHSYETPASVALVINDLNNSTDAGHYHKRDKLEIDGSETLKNG